MIKLIIGNGSTDKIMDTKSLISFIEEAGIYRQEDINGCSLCDLKNLFLHAINGLKEEAINLLKENNENFVLPNNAFVFLMHQGYEFCYFIFSDGTDPPVYQYVEGNGPPVLTWSSFSEFLRSSIIYYKKKEKI